MECTCVAYGDGMGDDPISGTFDVKEVIAKKDYKCIECGATIKRGHRYQAAHGKWPDAGWQTYRTCQPCARIREDMSPGSAFGMLREDIWECHSYTFDYLGVWDADKEDEDE